MYKKMFLASKNILAYCEIILILTFNLDSIHSSRKYISLYQITTNKRKLQKLRLNKAKHLG